MPYNTKVSPTCILNYDQCVLLNISLLYLMKWERIVSPKQRNLLDIVLLIFSKCHDMWREKSWIGIRTKYYDMWREKSWLGIRTKYHDIWREKSWLGIRTKYYDMWRSHVVVFFSYSKSGFLSSHVVFCSCSKSGFLSSYVMLFCSYSNWRFLSSHVVFCSYSKSWTCDEGNPDLE
jgi:hypothetical protein